ncbi:hypothetical protein OB955_20755 [Halobacteria archaeon AArc-m2/3/4]|uniref:Uncharacterized protein n=1 Tax=Natronoglomus mannanivorans TaxID=2979990 RepID=A0AAP2YYL7_9EURY|nr:hypothetical protein [Halobacteria archaeon AArc-xg1-1]MCU4975134.1 hypothetical protein [Halobacteria archaeon AArc-m2/3/4]
MAELERIKADLTGQPVPEWAAGRQCCSRCADVNDTVERYDAPPMVEQDLADGDEVIFFVSRKSESHRHGEEDSYTLSRGVHHRRHDGEYGEGFQLGEGRGTIGYHDAIVTAVVERTGIDYGKRVTENFDVEYQPDVDPDALTFAEVESVLYSAPQWGDEEDTGDDPFVTGNELPEPIVPLEYVDPLWPDGLQRAVYQHVQEHR